MISILCAFSVSAQQEQATERNVKPQNTKSEVFKYMKKYVFLLLSAPIQFCSKAAMAYIPILESR